MRLPFVLTIAALAALTAPGGAVEEPAFSAGEGFTISADDVEAVEGPGGKVALFEGNVVLEREGARLTGSHGIYRDARGLAVLWGGVRGTDEGASVSADTLRYFRDTDVAVLVGRASYADTAGTVTAPRISFHRREGIAVCTGGAAATDDEGKTELLASRIVYDFDRGEARASGEPVLTTRGDDGEVDVTLRADVVELADDGGVLRAYGSVGVVRKDARAGARVVTFFRDDETMLLEGDPFVDQEGDKLTGERIFAAAPGGELSRVLVTGRARASYTLEPREPGDRTERGSVSGDTLTMFFEGGEPILTTVRGGAASEHAVGSEGERNEVSARELTVLFDRGKVERAVFRGSAKGTYRFVAEGAAPGSEAAPPPEPAPSEPGSAPPLEPAPSESLGLDSVSYEAPLISYYVGRNRIVLGEGARVEYRDTVLSAEEIVFDPDAQVLSASGYPDLREKGERFVGRALSYDLDAESGAIQGGATAFEDGLYYGDRIARDADGALRVRGGVYTTCAAATPHYRLVSHQMKIYLDDKVVARPVILYIGKVPVFALPFYVFPIKKGRHSGFLIPQIELGISEDRGRFIRNFGYYWAPNDYMDATAWADYYDQTRWIAHLQTRYALRYVLSGSVDASFMEETLAGKRRWDLGVTHRQEIGRHWTAGASGDFRSDATYATDANQGLQESLNRSLHSQLWLRGRWSGLTTGVTLDRREDLDEETVTELLPKVEVSGSQRPLVSAPDGATGVRRWLSEISYSWTAKTVNDRRRAEDETTVHQGLGFGLSLRTTRRLLGWLNLSPHGSLTQNWYDRDKAGREFPSRLTYDAGVSAGTTVYGTFFPGIGRLAAVRHIVEPSATYSWTPEFAEYFDEDGGDRFHSFSGFGSTPRAREAVSVSLVNKLQLKLGEGSELRKLDNFMRVSTSSSYDLRGDAKPWSDIVSRAEVRPGEAVSVSWDTRHDAYSGRIGSSSVTATLSLTGDTPLLDEPWEERIRGEAASPIDELREAVAERESAEAVGRRPWDASASFRYARGADPDDATYWADGRFALSPTPGWRVNWNVHYDLRNREIASQEYVLYRDLHCWEAQLVGRYYAEEWQYYFRINVKAVPDIQLETGTKSLNRSVQ